MYVTMIPQWESNKENVYNFLLNSNLKLLTTSCI